MPRPNPRQKKNAGKRSRSQSRGRGGSRSQNRERVGGRQRKDPRPAVRDTLQRIDRIPAQYFNERQLVSIQVIREKSQTGIVTDEHRKILKKALENAIIAQRDGIIVQRGKKISA